MNDFLIVTNTNRETFCHELSENKEFGYRVTSFFVTDNGIGVRYTALMEIGKDDKAQKKEVDGCVTSDDLRDILKE